MTATGLLGNERYQLSTAPDGRDVLIVVDRNGRGEALARALCGRVIPCAELTFYFTPARAEKWRSLFLAGFSARRRHPGGLAAWSFERGRERFSLAGAMKLAEQGVAA